MSLNFLPANRADMQARGWDKPDFVLVSGDAYVDHPSFGGPLIARVLEKQGFRVAMLCQPDWRSPAAFKEFGRPRLGFLVTAGNLDSMVNHYTAAKKKRSRDEYSPQGKANLRPDRATIVYCNLIRQAFSKATIVIGGVEASLRRLAHYDYWDDAVRRSILVDSGADLLCYGMAENTIIEIANALNADDREAFRNIDGTCVLLSADEAQGLEGAWLPSFEEVSANKAAYARAFAESYREQDPVRGKRLLQQSGRNVVAQHKPAMPLTRQQLDMAAELPFAREAHPSYGLEGIPALDEVQFSIAATRGCFGACAFCALTFHQGRIVSSRSADSIVEEARKLTRLKGFKGYIHDVGGPTANFRQPACEGQLTHGACRDRQCLFPKPCKKLRVEHRELLGIMRRVRSIPGVKKAFIRSGIRYDYLLLDSDPTFLRELAAHHVSGQLKVAPEHVDASVLRAMGKPPKDVFDQFRACFSAANNEAGKDQYLVPYFISGHPGSDLSAAISLAEYMKQSGLRPEQVQDFYPTPGTLATAMYHTGINPLTGKPLHVPKDPAEKAMQRALLQAFRKENQGLARKALMLCNRTDLIGYGPNCLVPPQRGQPSARTSPATARKRK